MKLLGIELDVHAIDSSAAFDQQRQSAQGETATVNGIGDSAYAERVIVSGHPFVDLWVRKGNVAFRFDVVKDIDAASLQPLARTVLSHL